MDFNKKDGLALREFSRRLAEISVYRNERPLLRLLELLVKHSGIKIATLWKVFDNGKLACSIERAGYVPDPINEATEYLCEVTGSHIELFLKRDPFKTFKPWFINDVRTLPDDRQFNTGARISDLGLSSAFMIPLKVDSEGYENYFLNIYFEKKDVELEEEENAIQAISLKTAAIVMSTFDLQRSKMSQHFQQVTRDSVGDIDTFFSKVIEQVVPNAILARRYFLFTKDDVNKNSFWEFCSDDNPKKFNEIQAKKIVNMLTELNLDQSMSGWECKQRRFTEFFGNYDSILICPIRSNIEQIGSAGFIIVCDVMHKRCKFDNSVEMIKPFSKEQISIVQEIAERCASLFDIYLHEHRRQNMTNVLAHEILSPSIYIKSTSARLLRISQSLPTKERKELENINNTAGLQVSVCEGIFLSNQNRSLKFRDKYSPMEVPIHKSFVGWRKFLHPTCENFGLDFDNIEIDVVLPKVFMDLRALQVVFLNLCVNALKYSKDVTRNSNLFKLKIDSQSIYKDNYSGKWNLLNDIKIPKDVKNDGFIVLSFSDTGIGVPSHHKDEIFEEYFRVENEATSFRSGMGLGLSMVRSIVRDHCGEVWLANSENPTIFRVALPMFLRFEINTISSLTRKN